MEEKRLPIPDPENPHGFDKTPIRHEVHMDVEVANFWYDKYGQFKTANPKDFGQLTYAEYLGEQVLTNLMRLMLGKVPK